MSRILTAQWFSCDGVVSFADFLEAEDIRYRWINGHGPVKPERQSIIFYQNRPFDTDFACDVPHCQKCITEYKKELNFPYLDEHEVFV